jgi:hypothetical protein
MEPKKDGEDFDLNALDLEIFSTEFPKKSVSKPSVSTMLLSRTYIKAILTSTLLLFLFVSTFFIASRTQEPTLTTSSANVGYVPQAQIEIPKSVGVKSCSEVNYDSSELTFLQSFCQGNSCIHHDTKEDCENVDVVLTENGNLKEESGQDGVADCVWIIDTTSCKPKY